MTSVLLMFLLPVIKVQRVFPAPTCPVSCVVCSEDAVICQRLAHFIDAAHSTQALLLTEGSISAVQPASLSDLTNITVLGLSDNQISELGGESFKNLPFLQTLLLDHNFLTSQSLQGGALTNLTQLEVLALGHNLINMIQAGWFRGTKALLILKLEGNLLTSLDSMSFPLNEFRHLESLDLSDNLIQHLDRYSFRGLVSLKTLDLSRNRLSSAPAEAFTYLNWLTNLNLDLNSWNCTCELLELAAVLSSFIQQPDKTLYNGRRMVCVSADNPAVTTVLELTEANCVPSNKNITLRVETSGSVTPQLYARDLAVTAVICFIGGVGLTLLVVLIYHQVSRRKKVKESQRLKAEEEGGSSSVANHVNRLNVREKTRDFSFYANSTETWNKDAVRMDGKTERHGGQFRSRAEDSNDRVQCPHCNSNGQVPNPTRKDNWMNGGLRLEEDSEKRRVRMMMMEEERNRTAFQQQNSSRDVPNKFHSHITNSSSQALREMTETWPSHKTDRNMDNHRTDTEAKVRGHETLHCRNYHRMNKPPEQDEVQDRIYSDASDLSGRGRKGPFENVKNSELKREMRHVKFNMQSLRSRQGTERLEGDKEKGGERRDKVQTSRSLKVKLNLNPLRKSKIHPGRRSEPGNLENRSSKTRKEKRRQRKEREEEDDEGKHSRKSKSGSRKRRKSSKTGVSLQDGEKEKKDKQKGEEDGQQSSPGEQDKNPESSQPAGSTSAAGQPVSAALSAQSLQALHYQAAGSSGGTQFSSQHPFSLIQPDRNRTTNLSLLGPAGSHLTGNSSLLNTLTSGSNSLLPGNPVTPGAGFSGFNVGPRGSTENLSRQAAGGIMSSVPLLLANTAQASSLQSGLIQTAPVRTTQAELTLSSINPAANPALLSQSQLPSDSSALVTSLKPDPAQGQGFQTGEGAVQQAAPTKDGAPDKSQAGVAGVPYQAPEMETTVENVSNNSQTEPRILDVSLTEGPAPDMSAQGESSLAAAPALLQQEYLSEEGGSSPRRKLRLVLPEKTSSRPPTALERKIR